MLTLEKNIKESIMGWRYAFSHMHVKAGEVPAIVKRELEETVTGYGYGLKYARIKTSETVTVLQKGIEKSIAGWGKGVSYVGGKVGEHFGNIQTSFTSVKWWLLIPILILAFIAVMVSIGYSGVGGPAARVAEREYARRR
jgi:hypothetical protein